MDNTSKLTHQLDARILADAKDIQAAEKAKKALEGAKKGPNPYLSRPPLAQQKNLFASQLKQSGMSNREARRVAAATFNGNRSTPLPHNNKISASAIQPMRRNRQAQQSQLLQSNIALSNLAQSVLQNQKAMTNSGLSTQYTTKRPARQQKGLKDIATAYDNDDKRVGKRPIQQAKKWAQPLNGQDMLTAWDRYTVARAYPGSINSPYVNNMTIMPLPTGQFSISKSLTEMWDNETNLPELIGQGHYVCLFYCPSLSSFKGPGGSGNLSISTRLSGLATVQTDSLAFNCSDGLFIADKYAATCVGLYGSDFTSFATGGFVWSGQLTTHIVAPAATLVGACYKGTITLGQLAQGGIPLSTLIQDATVTCTGSYEHVLRSSVIEPSLVKDINQPAKADYPRFADCENETVSYVIYQTAVQSITAAGDSNYSFILHVDGNFVYYPKATDSFAYNLTSQAIRGNNVFTREGKIGEAIDNVANTTVKNSALHEEGWDRAKKLDESFVTDRKSAAELPPIPKDDDSGFFGSLFDSFANLTNENSIVGKIAKTAMSYAPLLFVTTPPQTPSTLIPKDDYQYFFRQLKETCDTFRGTDLQAVEFVPFKAWVDQCYFWYLNQPDWIDPAGITTTSKRRTDKSSPKEMIPERIEHLRDESKDSSFRKFR